MIVLVRPTWHLLPPYQNEFDTPATLTLCHQHPKPDPKSFLVSHNNSRCQVRNTKYGVHRQRTWSCVFMRGEKKYAGDYRNRRPQCAYCVCWHAKQSYHSVFLSIVNLALKHWVLARSLSQRRAMCIFVCLWPAGPGHRPFHINHKALTFEEITSVHFGKKKQKNQPTTNRTGLGKNVEGFEM